MKSRLESTRYTWIHDQPPGLQSFLEHPLHVSLPTTNWRQSNIVVSFMLLGLFSRESRKDDRMQQGATTFLPFFLVYGILSRNLPQPYDLPEVYELLALLGRETSLWECGEHGELFH